MNPTARNTSDQHPKDTLQFSSYRVCRIFRWTVWFLTGFITVALLTIGSCLLFLRSDAGEHWLTSALNHTLAKLPSGLSAEISAFSGPLPFQLCLNDITLKDAQGEWLHAQKAFVQIDWTALPGTLAIRQISLEQPQVMRLPELVQTEETISSSETNTITPQQILASLKDFLEHWPLWLPELRLDHLDISHIGIPQDIALIPLDAHFSASASAGAQGLSADLRLEQGASAPVTLQATLTPDLQLSLALEGSDLGYATLLPTSVAQNPELRIQLSGNGSLQNWHVRLNTALCDMKIADSETTLLQLAAQSDLQLLDATPLQADLALTLETGSHSQPIWKLLQQENGNLHIALNAHVVQDSTISINTGLSIELSHMNWGDDTLTALLGTTPSAHMSAKINIKDDDVLLADLQGFSLQASKLRATAYGNIHSGPNINFSSSDAGTEFHARAELLETHDLTSAVTGDASLQLDISGPFSALNTQWNFSSHQLAISSYQLEQTTASFSLPSANILHLLNVLSQLSMEDIPELKKDNHPILTGQATLKTQINSEAASFASAWSVHEQNGLLLTLHNLDLNAADIRLRGNISAYLPALEPTYTSEIMSAPLERRLPHIEGSLNLHAADWKKISHLIGQDLSGTALDTSLTMTFRQGQEIYLNGHLPSFQMPQFSLAGLQYSLKVTDLWERPHITLQTKLNQFEGMGASIHNAEIQANGDKENLKLSVASTGDINSNIKGHWMNDEFSLQHFKILVTPTLLGLKGKSTAGAELDTPVMIRYVDNTIRITPLALTFFPSGHLAAQGYYSPQKFDFSAELSDTLLERFQQLLPQVPSGDISAQLHVSGTPQAPSGNLKLNFRNIQIPGISIPALDGGISSSLGITGKNRTLKTELTLPKHTLQALGLSRADVEVYLPMTSPTSGITMPDSNAPLRGHIAIIGELGQLWKLVPTADQKLSGKLDIQTDLTGTIKNPIITLHASMDEGRFAEITQGIELRDIRLRADANRISLSGKRGQKLQIDFAATDGRKGSIDVTGWVEPSTLKLDIKGNIKDLAPLHRQDINIMLSGTFGTSGVIASPHITADISVNKGQVQLTKLPGGGITTLEIQEDSKSLPIATENRGDIDAHIRIPNQFFLRGYGLDCEWKGDIGIKGALQQPSVTGGLQAVRGTLDILGKNFKLSKGDISFDGGWPVMPLLNIVMEYTASSLTADITVGGTPSNPKLTLSSQPVMPQDEILSQIMFGQSSGSLSHIQALQLASGAASLAGFGGADVMGLGRKLLGVDVLKVNSDNDSKDSDASRTSLEMGTYVRDNIYVGVEQGVGKNNDTGAVVEIELVPGLDAQAKASGTRTEFGLEWKKNY